MGMETSSHLWVLKQMDGLLKPTTTEVLPAQKAMLEMVQRCKSNCSSGRCSCNAKYLVYTDMRQCSSQCQNDEDSQVEDDDDDYDDAYRLSMIMSRCLKWLLKHKRLKEISIKISYYLTDCLMCRF